ncbi:MAG: hypothetical protein U0073_01005 [Bacteroidia bacterium]
MSFYLAIICFISSVVIALVLMILGKNLGRSRFLLSASMHGILLLGFLASLMLRPASTPSSVFNYFFLIYFCTGVMLCGWVWRIEITLALRIYFSIFIIGFPMFLFSPSMMVNFLLTSHYTDSFGPKFLVQGNIWLESQSTISREDNGPHYKLVRKRGLYRETLARDLNFNGELDSVKLLEFIPGSSIRIRGYAAKETFVSTEIDSTEIDISLSSKKRTDIDYHL